MAGACARAPACAGTTQPGVAPTKGFRELRLITGLGVRVWGFGCFFLLFRVSGFGAFSFREAFRAAALSARASAPTQKASALPASLAISSAGS